MRSTILKAAVILRMLLYSNAIRPCVIQIDRFVLLHLVPLVAYKFGKCIVSATVHTGYVTV
jgi:hypothetical protein